MIIYKEFHFDAAHYLPMTPPTHKCHDLHGHTYTVILYVKGAISEDTGWVIDFGDIKASFKPILDILDHKCLNNIEGLENSTCENLSIWIWEKLKPKLPTLFKIHIKETISSGCIYEP